MAQADEFEDDLEREWLATYGPSAPVRLRRAPEPRPATTPAAPRDGDDAGPASGAAVA